MRTRVLAVVLSALAAACGGATLDGETDSGAASDGGTGGTGSSSGAAGTGGMGSSSGAASTGGTGSSGSASDTGAPFDGGGDDDACGAKAVPYGAPGWPQGWIWCNDAGFCACQASPCLDFAECGYSTAQRTAYFCSADAAPAGCAPGNDPNFWCCSP